MHDNDTPVGGGESSFQLHVHGRISKIYLKDLQRRGGVEGRVQLLGSRTCRPPGENQQKEEIISDDAESYSAECALNNIIYNRHYYFIMITVYALTLTYYFYIYVWLHTTQ